MAIAELAFEALAMAIETTKGTAIANPTTYINATGTLTPKIEYYRAPDAAGTLAEYSRSTPVRKWGEFEGEGPLDVKTLPLLCEMIAKGGVTATTPTNGILTRLRTYTPTMTSDDLKAATVWWGDPNAQVYRGAYGMLDTLTISGDAGGTDGAMMSFAGRTRFPTAVSAPTYPAQAYGDLIVPGNMQVWIDTGTIGTTAITGRVISAEHTIVSGISYKWVAQGTANNFAFDHHGRLKRHIETKLVMELTDQTQYNMIVAGTLVKVRVRHNGPLIESVTPDYYNYVEVDTYGTMQDPNWGELEGSNRTVEMTVISEYLAGASTDWAIKVQNTVA